MCSLKHRQVFGEINILALPLVSEDLVKSALAEPAPWIPLHLRCEMCTDDSVRAAVCCTDCNRRLCHKHADVSENIVKLYLRFKMV